jgi:hypothetical protein
MIDAATRTLVRRRAGNRCEYRFELDGARIVGKTLTGEVTVGLLKMNDKEHLEIRAGLIRRGEY